MNDTPKGRQGRMSKVEIAIAAAALAAVSGILSHVVAASNEATMYGQRLHLVAGINQEILGDIQDDLHAAVRLITRDQTSRGFQDVLDFSAGPMPIDPSILPTAEPGGIFEREMHTGQRTGNSLLFARSAWSTEFRCGSGAEYRIDVFRLVCYYLTKQGHGPRPGSNLGLDLCRWVSEPLADGDAIDEIQDPADRSEVLLHLLTQSPDLSGLTHDRVEAVWRPRSLAVDLSRIDGATGTLTDHPTGAPPSPWTIRREESLSSDGLLGDRNLSVVSNFAQGDYKVGRFAVMDSSGDGFPHGFEVQVVGPSFAAEVMLRLVIASDNPTGLQAKSDMRSDVSLRDFWSHRAPR